MEFTPGHGDLDGREEAKTWIIYVDGGEEAKTWIVHVDGSSTLYARRIGVLLQSSVGDKLKYMAHLQYQTTNSEIEYEAFLKGLELAKSFRVESIVVQGDSQLVMGLVNGTCEAKEE